MPTKALSDHRAFEIGALRFSWPGRKDAALSIDSLSLDAGRSLFLSGPSGCGKSTLLSIIAGVVEVPEGMIRVAGQDFGSLPAHGRDRFRADHIGMIFQVFNLLPWQSALQNVLLACRFSERRRERAGPDPKKTAMELLSNLGLREPDLIAAPAAELSIGQQQRVAAARALIGTPDLILADEPTSALDEETKAAFVDLLKRECAKAGSALLFVSHDRSLAPHFDRAVSLPEISKVSVPC